MPTRTYEANSYNLALTKTDVCDRCGAEAWVRTHLLTGGCLLMCRHHFQVNADALMPLSAHIHDERERLEKRERS